MMSCMLMTYVVASYDLSTCLMLTNASIMLMLMIMLAIIFSTYLY